MTYCTVAASAKRPHINTTPFYRQRNISRSFSRQSASYLLLVYRGSVVILYTLYHNCYCVDFRHGTMSHDKSRPSLFWLLCSCCSCCIVLQSCVAKPAEVRFVKERYKDKEKRLSCCIRFFTIFLRSRNRARNTPAHLCRTAFLNPWVAATKL